MAQHGVVSTVQPLAAMAGARILMNGGNAIDAAVATAAALNVTYPANVGLAGDLFTIIYIAKHHRIYLLNASGIAPSGLTLDFMHSLGYKWNPANFGPGSGMPSGGIAPPPIGTIFKNPDLAHTLRLIQEHGRDVFYKGEIARALVAKSTALGGTMTLQDLASYKGEWVTPASTTYHDQFTVYGSTAPSQAWGIVEAMTILEQCVPVWYRARPWPASDPRIRCSGTRSSRPRSRSTTTSTRTMQIPTSSRCPSPP